LIECLAFLQEQGIYYGDIKISNLIILKEQLKLIDYGLIVKTSDPLSKIIQSYNDLASYRLRHHSILTEPIKASDYHVMSDPIWALGITILEIIPQFDFAQ